MDYGKAFTYMFEDKDWVTKVLIGGILTLIPVVNLVVLGYALETGKRVVEGHPEPLPRWDNFSELFIRGLMAALGAAVWALPLILVALLTGFFGAVLSWVSESGSTGNMGGPFAICSWSLSCLSSIYSLFLGVVLPAPLTFYALSGDFGSFFDFRRVFRYISDNLGIYVVALLLAWVAQVIGGFGVILCFIGVIFTSFWADLVAAYLFGQVYRSRREMPAPVEPAV